MLNRILTVSGVVAVILLATPAAQAHVVHIDWKVTDSDFVVVAYFSDDLPADNAEVTLETSEGTVIASGKTDDTGTWKREKLPPGTYRLTVKAFASHTKSVLIDIAPPPEDEAWVPSGDTRWWLLAGTVTAAVVVLLVGLWWWRKR